MPSHSVRKLDTGGPLTVPGLLAADVRDLMHAAHGGAAARPAPRVLDGRHVALVATREQDPSAEVFAGAASILGARVAHIAPADLGLSDSSRPTDTARVLGRFYAAIGCAGLDAKSVVLLKRTCGVPVLFDLAAETHASRLLADLMTLRQTLSELVPSSVRPRLGVYGPARSALLRAWKKAAAGAGVDVLDLSGLGADAHAEGCHFVCRPGSPPELLAIQPAATRALSQEVSLLNAQRDNHRLVVQALLRNELGGRR